MTAWLDPLAAVVGATGAHWGLRRLERRLSVRLARRAGGPPRIPRPLGLGLLGVRLGLWVAAALFVSERVMTLQTARAMLASALGMSLRAPLFTLGERAYSMLDLLGLPAMLLVLWVGASVLTRLVKTRLLVTAGLERGAQETVGTLFHTALMLLGGIVALQAWGVNLSSLAMLASVFGIGIGFGLQNIANNFVSGLLISFEQPVKAGDFVSVAGFEGTVERVGSRSTEIRTLDHVTILVPNSRLLESEVVNWTHGRTGARCRGCASRSG